MKRRNGEKSVSGERSFRHELYFVVSCFAASCLGNRAFPSLGTIRSARRRTAGESEIVRFMEVITWAFYRMLVLLMVLKISAGVILPIFRLSCWFTRTWRRRSIVRYLLATDPRRILFSAIQSCDPYKAFVTYHDLWQLGNFSSEGPSGGSLSSPGTSCLLWCRWRLWPWAVPLWPCAQILEKVVNQAGTGTSLHGLSIHKLTAGGICRLHFPLALQSKTFCSVVWSLCVRPPKQEEWGRVVQWVRIWWLTRRACEWRRRCTRRHRRRRRDLGGLVVLLGHACPPGTWSPWFHPLQQGDVITTDPDDLLSLPPAAPMMKEGTNTPAGTLIEIQIATKTNWKQEFRWETITETYVEHVIESKTRENGDISFGSARPVGQNGFRTPSRSICGPCAVVEEISHSLPERQTTSKVSSQPIRESEHTYDKSHEDSEREEAEMKSELCTWAFYLTCSWTSFCRACF